jgi:hypothetical protein
MGAVSKQVNTIFPGLGGLASNAAQVVLGGATPNTAAPPPPAPAPGATPPRPQSPSGVSTPRPVSSDMGGTIITGPSGLKDPVSVSNKQLLGG